MDALHFIQQLIELNRIDCNEQLLIEGQFDVSADRTTIVIGDPTLDQGKGAIYIYRLKDDRYLKSSYIEAKFRIESNFYGQSVSVTADGTRIAVGTLHLDQHRTNPGGAYVIHLTPYGYMQEDQLMLINYDYPAFGYSVSISPDGHEVVVGAPNLSARQTTGVAYVYKRNGSEWSRLQQLKPSGYNGHMGKCVAHHDDTIIVSSQDPRMAQVWTCPQVKWVPVSKGI
jgi:hypothetical protein